MSALGISFSKSACNTFCRWLLHQQCRLVRPARPTPGSDLEIRQDIPGQLGAFCARLGERGIDYATQLVLVVD